MNSVGQVAMYHHDSGVPINYIQPYRIKERGEQY